MAFLDLFKWNPSFTPNVNVRVGTILKVHPKEGSHSNQPYLVKIIEVYGNGFKTELVYPDDFVKPHIRDFNYNKPEWGNYHCDRFEVVKSINL